MLRCRCCVQPGSEGRGRGVVVAPAGRRGGGAVGEGALPGMRRGGHESSQAPRGDRSSCAALSRSIRATGALRQELCNRRCHCSWRRLILRTQGRHAARRRGGQKLLLSTKDVPSDAVCVAASSAAAAWRSGRRGTCCQQELEQPSPEPFLFFLGPRLRARVIILSQQTPRGAAADSTRSERPLQKTKGGHDANEKQGDTAFRIAKQALQSGGLDCAERFQSRLFASDQYLPLII